MLLGTELALTVLSLALILVAAEIFTNAVEWLGVRLRLDSGVVGSILAAVGTAMPETIIPVVAIAKDIANNQLHTPESESQAIGMGAIIGAPFMLSTLAFFIVGLTYYVARRKDNRPTEFTASARVFRTDIEFFLVAFSIGIGMGLINHFWRLPYWITAAVGLCTIILYFYYVMQMFRLGEQQADNSVDAEDVGHDEELHPLWLTRWYLGPKTEPKKRFIVVQLGLALMMMFFGAHMFVEHLSPLALAWGIDPLLGEGIAPALESAAYGALRLRQALDKGTRVIRHYERRFKWTLAGRNLWFQAKLANLLYGPNPNRWLRVLFENQTLLRLASGGTEQYGRLAKTLPRLLLGYAGQVLRKGIPSNRPIALPASVD